MKRIYSDTSILLIVFLQLILLVIWLLMGQWGYDYILGLAVVFFLLPILVLIFQKNGKIKYGFLLIINLFIFGYFIFEIMNIYFGLVSLQSAMIGKAIGSIRTPMDVLISYIPIVIVLIVGLIPQIYILVKTIRLLKKQKEIPA